MAKERTIVTCDCGQEYDKATLHKEAHLGEWDLRNYDVDPDYGRDVVRVSAIFVRQLYCVSCYQPLTEDFRTIRHTITAPEEEVDSNDD